MALTWPTIAAFVSFDNVYWYDDGVATFTSMTARFKSASYRRGKQRQLNSPQAGTLTLVLDNTDGAIDPDNSASPYYGTMTAGRLVKLFATYNSVTYSLFVGRVTEWGTTELNGGNEPEVTLQVSDYMAQLAYGVNANGRNDGENGSGIMLAYWFSRLSGWSPIVKEIDDGVVPIFDLDSNSGSGSLNANTDFGARAIFDLMMQSEPESTYFFDGAGVFHYHDHTRRHGAQPILQATFDNDATAQAAGSLPFEDSTPKNDDTEVYNLVLISPYNNSSLFTTTDGTAFDTTSQTLHGVRTLARTLPIVGPVEAGRVADLFLAYHKDATPRITSIQVNGLSQVPALWEAILNLEISDPIRVRRRPYPVPANTSARNYFIEGYAVSITLDPPSWQVIYDVSPAIDGVHGPLIGGAGVAFPLTPATGDLYWRTDLSLLCFYDGSRWLTVQEYTYDLQPVSATIPTTAAVAIGITPTRSDYQQVVTRVTFVTNVQTTNNGSNYWTVAVQDDSLNTIQSYVTSADTAGTWTRNSYAPGVTVQTSDLYLRLAATTKTGSPGSLYVYAQVNYRLIVP